MALREDIKGADININCELTDAKLKLRDLLNLKEGDIIPINYPDRVTLVAEDVPVFRGIYGVHKGAKAVKILEMVERPKISGDNFALVAAGVES